MESLDLATKTLFADFQESVLFRFRLEQEQSRQATHTQKTVKNKRYWYHQTHQGSQKNKQTYLGPVNEKNTRIVEKQRAKSKKQAAQIQNLIALERKKIPLFKRAGFPEIDRKTAKVLNHFSRLRVSYQNGVLIGSLASFTYPGILGIIFDHGSLKTDIDIARNEDDRLSITTTEDLFQGFSEDLYAIPGLDHLDLPSSFIYQEEIKIDFLIPKKGKERKTYHFPGIPGIGAQALRYLEFLIEERVDGMLLSPNKAIPVTVPHPARFALHKMLVGENRGQHERAKREKDFHQANQLIIACAQEMPDLLKTAMKDLNSRGKKWKTLFNKAKKHLSPESQKLIPTI
jgi:hypothetical protein